MSDPFAMAVLSNFQNITSLTLWRVRRYAQGPEGDPEEPHLVVAAQNHAAWAFSVEGEGDGRFDQSNASGIPADAPASQAQAAVVGFIEEATGRSVQATWTQVNADTWTATASFA